MSADVSYGLHAVEELLRRDPARVRVLLLQRGRNDQRIAQLQALAERAAVAIEPRSREELDALAGGRHQGVVAALVGASAPDLRWSERQLLDAVAAAPEVLLLVLDGVTDPHNLGACLRSADAAGALAVVIPKDRSADITPTVRKVACGATESVPLARVTNLARTLRALREAGVWIYGAAGDARESVFASDLRGPTALVMGAEGSGLRRLTRELCDHLVSLPMSGAVSSLNVSVAAGICLFEARRQRLQAAAGG